LNGLGSVLLAAMGNITSLRSAFCKRSLVQIRQQAPMISRG
jgi:hypothetical protein